MQPCRPRWNSGPLLAALQPCCCLLLRAWPISGTPAPSAPWTNSGHGLCNSFSPFACSMSSPICEWSLSPKHGVCGLLAFNVCRVQISFPRPRLWSACRDESNSRFSARRARAPHEPGQRLERGARAALQRLLKPMVTTEFSILKLAYSRPGSLPRACAPTGPRFTGVDNI